MPRRTQLFAPRVKRQFKYAEMNGVLSFTAGHAQDGIVYNANSLNEPHSGGGHQPYGFDEITRVYQEQIVYGVKVDVTFANPAANDMGTVGIYWYDAQDFNAPTAFTSTNLAEIPNSIVSELGTSGNDKANRTISVYISIPKTLNVSYRDLLDTPDYIGTNIANPAKLARFYIWYRPQNTAAGASINYNLRLTFYAQLQDPINNAFS